MTIEPKLPPIEIGTDTGHHAPIGVGCSFYGISDWAGAEAKLLYDALVTSLEHGLTHFDTATGYGGGESEKLIGRVLQDDSSRRDKMFIASKANLDDVTASAILKAIDDSHQRLQTDVIDLYYIHWPRTGQDMRPMMEGLEIARQQGKIKAIGVSNFSVEQMQQVQEVGTIDAHQLGYNLLWRFPEKDIIPYCVEQNISVVVYSALAHGILSGKYERQLSFDADDQRWRILLFRDDVWSAIYDDVQAMKAIAEKADVSLVHLALRWLLHQASVTSVLVSAKNPSQAVSNAQALSVEISEDIFDEFTKLSQAIQSKIPDEGNPFGYHP